jgi:hypothetical protein
MSEAPIKTWVAVLPDVKKRKKKRKQTYIRKIEYEKAGLEPPSRVKKIYPMDPDKRRALYARSEKFRKMEILTSLRYYYRKKGMTKTCSMCKQELAIIDFDRRHASDTNAYHSYCKRCRKKHNRRKYIERLQKGCYDNKGYVKNDDRGMDRS